MPLRPLPLGRVNLLAAVAGTIVAMLVFLAAAGRTGVEGGSPRADALLVLLTALPPTLAWIAAAIGFGWPIRRALAAGSSEGPAFQVAAGVAALLIIDAAIGRLGLLQVGGAIGAWSVVLIGVGLLVHQIATRGPRRKWTPWPWPLWTAAPAVAVMLLAACSAPGWLWTTEFGGYDALAYHLQLPKEWMGLGAIGPLPHNVYGALPGFMEASFLHLMVLGGDPVAASYACQLLHAFMALGAAALCCRLATRVGGPIPGGVAAAVLLATPWVVVTGSLAYGEMTVCLMLAGSLLVATDDALAPARRGALVGLLAAAACGAKLTAVGFVVAPVSLVLLLSTSPRGWVPAFALAAATGVLGLSPWLVGNALAVGNPVFPFATGLLGSGPWTPEQAAIWREAHSPALTLPVRFECGFEQFLRYGIGPNPNEGEPWLPQWLLLGWVGVAAMVSGLFSPRLRRCSVLLLGVLLVQSAFWISFTHIKSRFMLPAVVPCAVAVGLGVALARGRWAGRMVVVSTIGSLMLALALLARSGAVIGLFIGEPGGAGLPAAQVGRAELRTGAMLDDTARREMADAGFVAIHLNHLLEDDSRVLLVGEAAPFYYLGDVVYQTTWDRGPLSRVMREAPDAPESWCRLLARDGFSHILVDRGMLARWEASGWNDPLLTEDRVMGALSRCGRVEARFGGGVVLFSIE